VSPPTYTYSGAFRFLFTVCQNLTSNPCPPSSNYGASIQLLNTGAGCQANWGYLGTARPALLSSDATQGMSLTYTGDTCLSSQFGGSYSTQLNLQCSNTKLPVITAATMTPDNCGVTLTLKTAAACPYNRFKEEPEMNPGLIAAIVVVGVLAVYLGGGIAYKRYKYGASGMEAVPNIDTWRRVGACLCCCCKGSGSPGLMAEDVHYTSVDTL